MSNLTALNAIFSVRKINLSHWLSAPKTAKPMTAYYPHGEPPYAIVPNGEVDTRVELGGRTYIVAGQSALPLPNCPLPDVALSLALRVWWSRKPLEVLAAVTAVLLLTAFVFALLSLSSAGSEYLEVLAWGASQGLAVMFYGGAVIAVLLFVSLAIWNFGKGLKLSGPKEAQQLLPSGEISIAPDLLMFANEDESHAEFAKRMEQARRDAVEGQIVVAIPYRVPYIVSFQKGGDMEATMSGQTPRWAVAHKSEQVCLDGADVSGESYADYMEFVRWYADGFTRWATAQRVEMSDDPFGSIVRLMGRMSATCFALLFCFGLSAQTTNTQKVSAYLGEIRAGQKPQGEVVYTFMQRAFTRKADGTKNFVELLSQPIGVASFNDKAQHGQLLGISVNDILLAPVDADKRAVRAEANAAPVSALPIKGLEFDSAGLSDGLDRSGRALGDALRAAEKVGRQWWESELMKYLLHILAALGGTLHMIAKICYNEHRMTHFGHLYGRWAFNIGNAASFALTLMALPIAVGVVLVSYIALVEYEGWALWYFFQVLWSKWTLFLLVWFVIIKAVERVTDAIVPNPKVRPTQGPFISGPAHHKGLPHG